MSLGVETLAYIALLGMAWGVGGLTGIAVDRWAVLRDQKKDLERQAEGGAE